MSGECKTYNLKKPMDWVEFKSMPSDLQKEYIRWLRARFGCNNSVIADMLGTGRKNFQTYVGKLGMKLGKGSGNDAWDVVGFNRWKNGEDDAVSENASEAAVAGAEAENSDEVEYKAVVPVTGSMDFEGDIHDICAALGLLLGGAKVALEVAWRVVPEEEPHE